MIGAGSNKPLATRATIFTFCLSLMAFCFLGCSIPKLEDQRCSEARDTVKEFYSWYLGTDPQMRAGQPDVFERFVSPGFRPTIAENQDPFFLSGTTPTTFKIGKCEAVTETKAEMQVQLYWREDGKTDQKEVFAELTRTNDRWLIENVESR